MAQHDSETLDSLCQELGRRAVEIDGVPHEAATKAARATRRRFAEEAYGPRTQARARAYFAAVVRNTLVRTRASGPAAARLVIASVVADLTAAGRDPQSVWGEIERGWAGKVPGVVLEEYRARLCA